MNINSLELIPEVYGGVAAFLTVVLLMPLCIKLAIRLGFTDQPGGRKRHDAPVPPIGGVVIFPIMMIVGLLSGIDMHTYWALYVGLGLILVVGALDDYRHIDPWVKFAVQFLAAGIVVIGGHARLYTLGNLFGFGGVGLDFMSIPFSIIAVVLFINALNLMDGLDGLAGGIGFCALFWLIVGCVAAQDFQSLYTLGLAAGAVLGFLVYNFRAPWRKKASVFLGDAGSMGLALVLAWFCMDLAQEPVPKVIEPIAIAWIIGLPILDVCAQFYRRARAGRHPFSADRGHFHHHFIGAGFSAGQATCRIVLISFIFGAIGFGAIELGLPEWVLCVSWIAMILAHIWVSARPGRYINFLKTLRRMPQS